MAHDDDYDANDNDRGTSGGYIEEEERNREMGRKREKDWPPVILVIDYRRCH